MAAEEASGKRSTGIVKWFSAQRGFGFVAPDDGDEDLFVHQTAIRSEGFRTLLEGQPVEFSIDVGEDGRAKAMEVAAMSRSRRVGRGGGGRSGLTYFGRGRSRRGDRGGYGGRSGRGGRYGGRGGDDGGGVCYNCGRMGHFARDCYRGSGNDVGGGGGGDGGRRRYGGGGGGACFNCREEGHFARDCPNNTQH